ncbi:MAG: ABC transporter permease [Pirellulales bacterium]|nr:ABC transporter permease [Pirellulales bacterium]
MSELLWAANPLAVARHYRRYRYLLWQLTRREVEARYRGSFLGLLWSLLTPLIMLAVYTFVFTVVLQVRWGTAVGENRADFALALFAGLTAFGLFSETIGTAPELILANRNYVTRVVFPLEILPVARFLANLVQAAFSTAILVLALLVLRGGVPWTFALLPVALLPLALLSLGGAFFLSSLGVFIRDIQQVIGLVTTALLFLSAVFYPLSSLDPSLRPIFMLNPLVPMIEDVRRVTLDGLPPDWALWGPMTLLSAVLATAGLAWFMKSKHAFADVL